MNPTKILLAHPGTQHSHQLAKQLFRKNMLYQFITGLVVREKGILHRVLQKMPRAIRSSIQNRVINILPANKIKSYPMAELKFVRSAAKVKSQELNLFKRNEDFQKRIPSRLLKSSDVVVGFDTSSLVLAERTKALDKKFILDVSIAHSVSKNKVYQQIATAFPEWSFTTEQKTDELLEIETQEYAMADAIVVAGSFTKQTLVDNGVEGKKIFINPYGIDISRFKGKKDYGLQKPIRFLFVGLVDARKGIPLLMDTIKNIPKEKASFTLVGHADEKVKELVSAFDLPNVYLKGKIPHKEINHVFQEHDVFVFPSYFEGFGLVILEAMASGLPVIITEATAGKDCVTNGQEGFVIKSGNGQQLEQSINHFIDNPNQIKSMGMAARKKAEQFTWDAYGDRWESIINEVLTVQSQLS